MKTLIFGIVMIAVGAVSWNYLEPHIDKLSMTQEEIEISVAEEEIARLTECMGI